MKEKFRYDYMQAIKSVKSNFHFKFPNKFCALEADYEKKKDEASKLIGKNSKEESDEKTYAIINKLNEQYSIGIEQCVAPIIEVFSVYMDTPKTSTNEVFVQHIQIRET